MLPLTLIHLTPYRYSYHLTYMPFPSAQCEYLFWIRSGGNVCISFLLLGGGRGRCVHCILYTERRGGARAQFRRKYVVFYALLALFAQNECKKTTFASYKRTLRLF